MAKTKISHNQEKSSKNTSLYTIKDSDQLIPYSPTQELLDENFIGKVIIECLKNNDPEGVMEVIAAHLNTLNKVQSARSASIARSTLYSSLKNKNPTIKTLAKLMYASTLKCL